MDVNVQELKKRLAEAEEAYHKLLIGDKEAGVSIGGFGSTTYTQTTKGDLEGYITSLKAQIARAEGKPPRQIIKVSF